MPHTVIKFARGTSEQIALYAGPLGELVIDSTVNTVVVQNGAIGGVRLARMADLDTQATRITALENAPTAVSYTAVVTSGTKIGSLSVDGQSVDIFAPAGGSGGYTAGTGIAITNSEIGLAVSGVTAGSYGPSANASPSAGGTFTVPYITVDGYGRVTQLANKTVTLPSDIVGSVVSVSPALSSGTKVATLTIDGTPTDLYAPAASATYTAGTGLSLTDTEFSLSTSGATAGSYGPSTNASPAHSGTFSVPYITVDAYGRVTAASTKTITLPADNNTTYTGTSPITVSGTAISHANSGATAGSYGPSANASPAHSGTFSVPYITVNATGHVTAVSTKTITLPAASSYTLPTATSSALGGIKVGTTLEISSSVLNQKSGVVTAATVGPSANSSPGSGGTFTVPQVKVDTYGRVTSLTARTITMPTVPSTSGFVTITGTQTVTGTKYFQTGVGAIATVADSTSVSATNLAFAAGASNWTGGYKYKWGAFHVYASGTTRRACMYTYTPNNATESNNAEAGLYVEAANTTINMRLVAGSNFTAAGSFRPQNKAIGMTLGDSSNRWGVLYSTGAVNTSSDRRLKEQIAAFPDEVLDAWGKVNFVQYRLTESIQKQGIAGARLHSGLIAQDIETAFSDDGLNAADYSLFCYDKWEKVEPEYDESGNVVNDPQEAGDLYSLRYAEALCMEAAYQRRRADRLEAAITELKARLDAIGA